jgi:hypothetical protein
METLGTAQFVEKQQATSKTSRDTHKSTWKASPTPATSVEKLSGVVTTSQLINTAHINLFRTKNSAQFHRYTTHKPV